MRAIAACPIPVVSGVGHETDTTLADFVADLRAPTPTAAAELSAPSRLDSLAVLDAAAAAMQRRLRRVIDTQAQRLDTLAMRSLRPVDAVRRQAQGLNLWSLRLASAAQRLVATRAQALQLSGARFQRNATASIQSAATALDRLDARLRGLDPAGVLKRGYAWVSDDSGRPLVSASQLSVGQSVCAVLSDGMAVAEITSVTKTSG